MKKQVIAMVLVGGRGSRLENITKNTAKPAVSFGGKYRLIDFVLSNLSNSSILTCGIITQYEPHELMSYIGFGSTWDLDINDGGISFLTPYTTIDGDVWQKGTAHAINQHFKYIDQHNPDYVLILSGDHIYKMDYQKLIDEHIKNNAEITISAFNVTKNPTRFGIIETSEHDEVIGFEEKPEHPKSALASMGIYVFNKKVLQEILSINQSSNFDFGKDIIPLALNNNRKVYAYQFDGYFRDVGTIKSLYEANMDLIDNPQYLKLHEYKEYPVYTKSSNLPPHHIADRCIISESMISDGCLVYGDVYHSIFSSGVLIKKGCLIKDSIIFENTVVGRGCTIMNTIILSNCVIPDHTELVFNKPTVVDQDLINKAGDKDE